MSSGSRTYRMSRGSAVALAVLLVGVGTACSNRTDEPTPASTGAATTATPAPAEPERISGDFEISNTTEGGAAVTVETIAVSLESAPAGGDAWTSVAAFCTTTPAPPIRIEMSLRIAYDCRPAAAVPAERRRIVVRAEIAGSDEVFRIVSEIPR